MTKKKNKKVNNNKSNNNSPQSPISIQPINDHRRNNTGSTTNMTMMGTPPNNGGRTLPIPTLQPPTMNHHHQHHYPHHPYHPHQVHQQPIPHHYYPSSPLGTTPPQQQQLYQQHSPHEGLHNRRILPHLDLEWSEVMVRGAEVPAKRGFHSCACVGNKMYIIGGDAQVVFFKDVYTFNIAEQTWESNEKSLNSPRTGHTCVHYNGYLYVFGGKQSRMAQTRKDSYLNDLMEYNIAKKEWSKIPSNIKLQSRGAHSCSVIESQRKMYIFGGLTTALGSSPSLNNAAALDYLNSVYVFDFDKREWSKPRCTGDIPPTRAGHSSCVVDDFIYIFGGRNGSNLLQDFYVLDTRKMVWKKIYQKNPPSTRAGHSMCYYAEGGCIILWGGGDWGRFFDEVLTFDVSKFQKTGEWRIQSIRPHTPVPQARFWHTMTIHQNLLYIFGGGNKCSLFNDIYVLNLSPLVGRAESPVHGMLHQHKRTHSQPNLAESPQSIMPISRGTDHMHSSSTGSLVARDLNPQYIFGFKKIKTVYQGEMRVLKIPPDITYNELLQRLRTEYSSNGVVIRYCDEDNDAITIRSDDELRSAAEFFASAQVTPRFEIEIVKSATIAKAPVIEPQPHNKNRNVSPAHEMQAVGERRFSWTRGVKIGEGAYGTVYKAMNNDTGEFIAAKHIQFGHIKDDAERQKALAEISHEIELMKNIAHPNIVQYLGVERHSSSLYIFLELVSGGSLASILKEYPLKEPTVRIFTKQILTGLKYLHDNNIVHRDIKGANILVGQPGPVIKLADFGHSRVISDSSLSMKSNKSVKGTPMWMAPEAIRTAKHGPWSDIWSVGCVIVEMLTGSYPYPELVSLGAMEVMLKIGLEDIRPTVRDVSVSVECRQFLDRIFIRDHNKRATVDDLLQMDFVTRPYEGDRGYGDTLSSPISDDQNSELLSVDSQYVSSDDETYVSDDDTYVSDEDEEGEESGSGSSYVSGDEVSDDEDEEGAEEDDASTSSSYLSDDASNQTEAHETLASIEKQMQNLRIASMRGGRPGRSPSRSGYLPSASHAPTTMRLQGPLMSQQLNQIRPQSFSQVDSMPSQQSLGSPYSQFSRMPVIDGGSPILHVGSNSVLTGSPETLSPQFQRPRAGSVALDRPEANDDDIKALLSRVDADQQQQFGFDAKRQKHERRSRK